MIRRIMFWLIGLAFASSAVYAEPGRYRGHERLSRIIHARFCAPGADLMLVSYLGDEERLLSLMGEYQEVGPRNRFQNASPNTLNLVIHHIALASLADDFSRACEQGSGDGKVKGNFPVMSKEWKVLLAKICAAPPTRENLTEFWSLGMGFDAPAESFDAWIAFIEKASTEDKSRRQLLALMFRSILLDPYFLLSK